MIGYALNGHTVLAAAPDGRDSWAILARSNDPTEFYQYVTSSVHVSQLPSPTHWGQGHYIQTLVDAAEDFASRLVEAPVAALAYAALTEHLLTKPDLTEGGKFAIVEVDARAACSVEETWTLKIDVEQVPEWRQVVDGFYVAAGLEDEPEVIDWLNNDTPGITVVGVADQVDNEEDRRVQNVAVLHG